LMEIWFQCLPDHPTTLVPVVSESYHFNFLRHLVAPAPQEVSADSEAQWSFDFHWFCMGFWLGRWLGTLKNFDIKDNMSH